MSAKVKMLEVKLQDPDDFLVVKETLTRMGKRIERDGDSILKQCCYILHKKGRYFIAHENELRNLDGDDAFASDEDIAVRDSVGILLNKWGLCEMVGPLTGMNTVYVAVVPHRDKAKWRLVSDYDIGKIKDAPKVPRQEE